ncbi:DUF3043 domain-containing protein [Bifidobacterium asteroides]|uniref:DUF3043 domain-containing protein n=1 Tax=Bifidobacterium TaxID=1678 RepID=UPI000D7895E1|nr:DUF3043 domain-containing protein [Bifidobacterium asteroides]MBH9983349.1 DUF3043 domain-containing protein [Bifidobacterium asteroides]PXY87178.1 DUF3043 domain-containing protein [Bifidobacterium asteroides]
MTWNPFSRKDRRDKEAEADQTASAEDVQGKGRPTPKRKQAEARNLRPLVPKDRKASRKAAKARIRAREDAQYEAMRTGDIDHMPKSERLPWRIYIRDYVDARFNLLEWIFPAIILMFVATLMGMFVGPQHYATFTMAVTILLYAYLIVALVDTWLMWRKLKRLLIDRFGERSVAKGSRSASYAWQRAMMVRRWRVPKPNQSKRGHWPK